MKQVLRPQTMYGKTGGRLLYQLMGLRTKQLLTNAGFFPSTQMVVILLCISPCFACQVRQSLVVIVVSDPLYRGNQKLPSSTIIPYNFPAITMIRHHFPAFLTIFHHVSFTTASHDFGLFYVAIMSHHVAFVRISCHHFPPFISLHYR